MVRNIFLILFIFGQLLALCHAKESTPISLKRAVSKQSIRKKIENDLIYISTNIKTIKKNEHKNQKMTFRAAALHPQSCSRALKKIARYETYQKSLTAVKTSRYDDKTERIHFVLQAPFLPRQFILNFKFSRMTKPGVYPFTFEWGFLKGLLGEVHASDHKGRCFLYAKADWLGPHSGFPDPFFEFFTTTLTRISFKSIIRMSRI